MCAFDDKRFLLEDSISSLAFGHHDIPTQIENIDDGEPDAVILGHGEAVDRGIVLRPAADPTLANPRPCLWMERRQQRVTNAKDFLREQLGFDDGDEEIVDNDEDEDDDNDGGARTTSRSNPFILTSCIVSRKRRVDSDSD